MKEYDKLLVQQQTFKQPNIAFDRMPSALSPQMFSSLFVSPTDKQKKRKLTFGDVFFYQQRKVVWHSSTEVKEDLVIRKQTQNQLVQSDPHWHSYINMLTKTKPHDLHFCCTLFPPSAEAQQRKVFNQQRASVCRHASSGDSLKTNKNILQTLSPKSWVLCVCEIFLS